MADSGRRWNWAGSSSHAAGTGTGSAGCSVTGTRSSRLTCEAIGGRMPSLRRVSGVSCCLQQHMIRAVAEVCEGYVMASALLRFLRDTAAEEVGVGASG